MNKVQKTPNKKSMIDAGFAPEELVQKTLEQAEVEENPDESEEEIEEEPQGGLPADPVEAAKVISEVLSKSIENAPSAEQLLSWKAKFGEIYIQPIFDKFYIFRNLFRKEYTNLMQDKDFANLPEYDKEAYIVDRCLLWPQMGVIEKTKSPGGLYSTLHEIIKIRSMFLDPTTLADFTIKL